MRYQRVKQNPTVEVDKTLTTSLVLEISILYMIMLTSSASSRSTMALVVHHWKPPAPIQTRNNGETSIPEGNKPHHKPWRHLITTLVAEGAKNSSMRLFRRSPTKMKTS